MAGVVYVLTNSLAEFGVGTATLHMAELDDHALHQLHGFSLMLCTGAYIVSVLLSPLIAHFFREPHLVVLLAVTNLVLLVTGFQAVPTGLLQRDMDYRRLSISEAALAIVQAIVTVVGAWLGWGYWALAAGLIAGKSANAVMVMWWKPLAFAFPRWKDIRAPIEFGSRAAIGQLAWSAYLHSDGIIVGRMLGDAAMGAYQMALNFANAPAEKISMLIMRTAGPLFANVQTEPQLVRRYFLLLVETLNMAVVPAMAGLVMVAPEAVEVVLGSKWVAVTLPLMWMAAYMIVSTMNSLVTQVLVSQRQTKFTMRVSLFNMIVMPVAFILGARWNGTAGVAAAWLLATPITSLPSAIKLVRQIGISWTDYVMSVLPTLSCAGAMIVVLAVFRHTIGPLHWSSGLRLGLEIMVGGATYSAVMFTVFREKIKRYLTFLRGLRGGRPPDAEPGSIAGTV